MKFCAARVHEIMEFSTGLTLADNSSIDRKKF